jgi:acyl-CoA synthetase (NDP forming)
VLADDIEELASIAACAVAEPSLIGRERINILSNSGGVGVLAADMASEAGLTVPQLDDAAVDALRSVLPEFIHPSNPTDISLAFFDRPEVFGEAIEVVGAGGAFDVHLVTLMGVDDSAEHVPQAILNAIAEASVKGGRPTLVHLSTMRTDFSGFAREQGLTVVPDLRRGIRALGKLSRWNRITDSRPDPHGHEHEVTRPDTPDGKRSLSEAAAKALLSDAGLPTVRGIVGANLDDAVAAAAELGYPVAIKVVSPDIPHKAAVGGLALDIGDENQLRARYAAVMDQPGARIEGVLVEPMAGGGVELLVALRNDSTFGYVLVLGLGGYFVELLADVALRVTPVADEEIEAMLRGLRGRRLLFEADGTPRVDLPALVALVQRLISRVSESGGRVEEVELNPVTVREPGRGALILDALWTEGAA